jgi:catechol 2,3-dioxygenase-like lactoylglutathione lyase family enzyme
VKVIKLAWLGTRTDRAPAAARFFTDVLGLQTAFTAPGFWVLTLPDGAKVEVFGPESPDNRHFVNGPVAGFLVDDVRAAADELKTAGIEIVHGPIDSEDGNAWVHFRAPDGNLYELTQDPGVSRLC